MVKFGMRTVARYAISLFLSMLPSLVLLFLLFIYLSLIFSQGATFVFTITTQRAESPPATSPPLEHNIASVCLVGRPCALREKLQSHLRRLDIHVTVVEQFNRSTVESYMCTIVVDGEDVDWSQEQTFATGSQVLALSRELQASTKVPLGLSFLRKPIKFQRFMQYLSSILFSYSFYFISLFVCLFIYFDLRTKYHIWR